MAKTQGGAGGTAHLLELGQPNGGIKSRVAGVVFLTGGIKKKAPQIVSQPHFFTETMLALSGDGIPMLQITISAPRATPRLDPLIFSVARHVAGAASGFVSHNGKYEHREVEISASRLEE